MTKKQNKLAEQQEQERYEKFEKGHFKFVPFQAKNQKQQDLFDACFQSNLVIAVGPAGTGKSITEAAAAARMMAEKQIDEIILTRNPLPTGQTTGFNPGTAEEKLAPWLAPIISNLKKVMQTDKGKDGLFNYLMEKRQIRMLELESVKGSSFDDAFIIVEECQEMPMETLKNLSTRAGEGATLLMNGDSAQGNIRLKGSGDWVRFVESIKQSNSRIAAKIEAGETPEEWEMIVPIIEFTKEDCVRSGLCRLMLEIFDEFSL
ncbi:PhoH-like protein [Vibrio phage vB_VcorM_GR28A]|nr:PhoH-like protein [Vibrio phage vB_VcorM_GR28A]